MTPEMFAPLIVSVSEYVSRYFADSGRHPERGVIDLGGEHYVMLRAGSMSVDFFDTLRAISGDCEAEDVLTFAQELLFDLAHGMGMADARAFNERHAGNVLARMAAAPAYFAHLGLGTAQLIDGSRVTGDETHCMIYDHPTSFEASAWQRADRRSNRAVCSMGAGYSSGWCEASTGVPMVAVEILCRAKGDDHCRFVMAPPENVAAEIASYLEAHPELREHATAYVMPRFPAERRADGASADRASRTRESNRGLETLVAARARELSQHSTRLQRDVSERERTQAKLSASEELNQRIIEALPGGLVHVDLSGAILTANDEACRILGLSYDELTQRYTADFETETVWEDGSAAAATDYPVSRAITTGQRQPPRTIGVRRPDGEISWAIYTAVPLKDRDTNETTGAVVTFVDITERKREEEQRERMEQELQQTQKLESLGVLAGGIAHDFNNLLVGILTGTSGARRLLDHDSEASRMLGQVEMAAERAATLTKQMLAYAGKGTFRVERLLLSSVVEEMAGLLRASIPPEIEFRFELASDLPSIRADAAQLQQVVMNLITNAAESVVNKHGVVTLATSRVDLNESSAEDSWVTGAPRAGTYVSLEISDNGSGMSAETRAKIFDPFFTTKFRGRGLGLSAVGGIIRSHGGAISLKSELGKGTRFRVLFPCSSDAERAVSRSPAAVVSNRLDGARVLVADDDPVVRSTLRSVLKHLGCEVEMAPDGQEAIQLFSQAPGGFDLVLLDLTMPRLGGIETFQELRRRNPNIPVVLASGYSEEVATRELPAEGLAAFIQKPFTADALQATLVKALSRT